MLQGDLIGIHSRHGRSAGIAFCDEARNGNRGACAHGEYGMAAMLSVRDGNLPVGVVKTLTSFKQKKFAIRASFK